MMDLEHFHNALSQQRIALMDNHELVIVPAAVQCGDVVCIFSGASSPCALRPDGDGHWTLVSGDCSIFTERFRPYSDPYSFMCDEYIKSNDNRIEEFIVL